jgi:hypothetical protein
VDATQPVGMGGSETPGLSGIAIMEGGEHTAAMEVDWYLLQCGHYAWMKLGTPLQPTGVPPTVTVACEICDPDYGIRKQRRVVRQLEH